jgi:hypothetical protein
MAEVKKKEEDYNSWSTEKLVELESQLGDKLEELDKAMRKAVREGRDTTALSQKLADVILKRSDVICVIGLRE